MARHQASLRPKALREAILEVLGEHDLKSDTSSFCSLPVPIRGYWVVTVIQLERQAVESMHRLKQERRYMHEMRYFPLERSLLDAAIQRVLVEAEQELSHGSQGENIFFAGAERVLEDAAVRFVATIGMRTNLMAGGLFNVANTISAERYEGAEGRGRILIARQSHPNILARIRLKVPVSIGQYRGIRKLLETSSEELALLCDGMQVWGLGIPQGAYDPAQEDLLRFTTHYKWELLHAEHVMMRVDYRRPKLPMKRFDEGLFRDHFERIFQGQIRNVDALTEAVQAAVEQKHGTILTVTAAALAESGRLAAQSTVIDAEPISREIVNHISRIDGAVLVAPDGLVHAFDVILDGVASSNGTSARGARFNSAIRYVDAQQEKRIPCLALIVSEDGYVDLYPKLRPRVLRSKIDKLLDALDAHVKAVEGFDADAAWEALSELSRLRFYLLEKDIDRANLAKQVIVRREEAARAAEVAGTLLGYAIPSIPDFAVSPEMSDAYYLPED